MTQYENCLREITKKALKEVYNTTEILDLPKAPGDKTFYIGSLRIQTAPNSSEILVTNPLTRSSHTISILNIQMLMRHGLVTRNISDFGDNTLPESHYQVVGINYLHPETIALLKNLDISPADGNPPKISLKPQPDNHSDPNAIQVMLHTDNTTIPIGYIQRYKNQIFNMIPDLEALDITLHRGNLKIETPDTAETPTFYLTISRKTTAQDIPITLENSYNIRKGDRILLKNYMIPGTVSTVGETLIPNKTFPMIRIVLNSGSIVSTPVVKLVGGYILKAEKTD